MQLSEDEENITKNIKLCSYKANHERWYWSSWLAQAVGHATLSQDHVFKPHAGQRDYFKNKK